jgi:hypothetical protein
MDELKMDLEPRRGVKATAKPFSSFRERWQNKRHKKLLGALKKHQAGRSRTIPYFFCSLFVLSTVTSLPY